MHALGVKGELLDDPPSPSERPTIPVPAARDSGVCPKVTRIPLSAVTVDTVICDLSRDPRSEDYTPGNDFGPATMGSRPETDRLRSGDG